MTKRKLKTLLFAATATMMGLGLVSCKSLKVSGAEPEEMPGARTGFLPAKAVAFRHAMENMPEDDKRYGAQKYEAMGIFDPDPAHAKVLQAALAGIEPPVIETSEIYTRDENSKWLRGKPVVIWTSQVQRVTEDVHVFVALGWMHSNLLYQFYEYEVRWIEKNDSWELVDFKLIDKPGS